MAKKKKMDAGLDSLVAVEPGNLDNLLQTEGAQAVNTKIETLFQSIYDLGYSDGAKSAQRKTFVINPQTGGLERLN